MRRFSISPWMSSFAVSLLLLLLLLPEQSVTFTPHRGLGVARGRFSRRETNPPFPAYSEEVPITKEKKTDDDDITDSSEDDVDVDVGTTAEPSEEEEVTTQKSYLSIRQSMLNNILRKKKLEEEKETSSSTLLTPLTTRQSLPPLSTSTFSALLVNKTSRYYANNNNANSNLFRLPASADVNNVNNGNAINRSTSDPLTTPPRLPARPTIQSVINPTTTRIVKRKKLVGISALEDNPPETTAYSPGDEELGDTTTLRAAILQHQNASRAIAGFSKTNRISVKGRPKPIIIRDHEAERNSSIAVVTSQSIVGEESDSSIVTELPTMTRRNNNVHGHFRVRKVKVTMGRRPGPGVEAVVTSDLPIEAVSVSTTMATPTEDASSSSTMDNVIRPSPPAIAPVEGVHSRRVFKEEFGIVRDSYDHDHDQEDLEDGSHEEQSDMEEATTEHSYFAIRNVPKHSNEFQLNIRKNHTETSSEIEEFTTPIYRDYFDVRGKGKSAENLGQSAENSPAVNVNTNVNTNVTLNPSPTASSNDTQIYPPPTPTPTLPSDLGQGHVTPPLTNSVEDNSSSQEKSESAVVVAAAAGNNNNTAGESPKGPKVNAKATTAVYYTKVEDPHFTSSSYEFSTTKEYSSSFSSNDHDDDDDEDHHGHEHGHDHDDDHEHEHVQGQGNSVAQNQFFQNSNGTVQRNNSSSSPTAAPSSQVSVLVPRETFTTTTTTTTTKATPTTTRKQPDSSEGLAETEPTQFPEISNNSFESHEEEGSSEKGLSPRPPLKGLPTVNVPLMYQVPVLVKMELKLERKTFCSNLLRFKELIVKVYQGKRKTGATPVLTPDQIVLYSEPNCTSTSTNNSDIVPEETPTIPSPTETSSLVKSTTTTKNPPTTTTTTTTKDPGPLKNYTVDKNVTEALTVTTPLPLEEKVSNKTRRKRQISQRGESLILDNRKASLQQEPLEGFNLFQLQGGNGKALGAEETVSVYFYIKDKEGNYDKEMTMAFYSFWNESYKENNGTFQGVFYEKIKRVDMVSAQLVSPGEDDSGEENSGVIAAILIASITATCLFLIGVLLLVLRHRQSATKFAKRCTPVTLDDFSLDNISFSNSFRRKQRLRGSKRSYTNAAFDDHTAPSRLVNASTLPTALKDSSGLDAEFKAIPNVPPTLDDIPQGAETKNRYANVIPMPDTRVLLTFQEEMPNSDYINANFIRGVGGDAKKYIITQGPLEETVTDFWRMVWEQQVRVIFMLTDFAEGGHAKCAEYYPRSETIDCSQLHGDFQVTLERRDMTDHAVTSYLVIKDMERSLRRDVVHVWYHSWPEKGVPSSGKVTTDFILQSRKFTKEPASPVLVHCSPGTGRSGTFVACDIAMKEFELQGKVDIPRLVLKLRQDRAGCVQTREQYIHIYDVLHYYATRYLATTKLDPIIGTVP